ncbi:MAG: hypothetical protein MSS71_09235 [Campylobacter sp.]|uniref:hypothetical protein n=1 Tax=Campylobacter sp. TaxID=205 RepID=UPI002AA7C563|nr:hypothetical protein [Campylobacter sp.]MCI7588012.1 hypothetical protein [Campylobacter sp.]
MANNNNQHKEQTMETQNKEKLGEQMLEIKKVEELRKKMFKAPNKDEINEIVEKDLITEYQTTMYERLSKAKDEKELDKLIFEGIQNGSITKEDWYPVPKNEQELHDKEKNHFYLTEAMIEEIHADKIWEKIKDKINDKDKEEVYTYTDNLTQMKPRYNEIREYENQKDNEAQNIEQAKRGNELEYVMSQECHKHYLNFIREDKSEKFALSQIEDYTNLKENNTFYLKDKSLNKKTYDFENRKYPIILEVTDEFSNNQQNLIIERLNLMLKYEKIKDPKTIEEIKKITNERENTNDKEFAKEIQELRDNFSNPKNIEKLEQYNKQSINNELKKEFANTQKASSLYIDIQKNQHKFQYYTPIAKQQFLNKIMDLKELKDYMPKEAIEKMQETTQNISKQLENRLTR